MNNSFNGNVRRRATAIAIICRHPVGDECHQYQSHKDNACTPLHDSLPTLTRTALWFCFILHSSSFHKHMIELERSAITAQPYCGDNECACEYQSKPETWCTEVSARGKLW